MLFKIILFIISTMVVLGTMLIIAALIDEKEANNKLITEELDAWKEQLSKEDTNK